MRKLTRAGAVALATVGAFLISTPGTGHCSEPIAEARSAAALSEGEIARIKDTLKLTSVQERLWSPFAAALRSVARNRLRGDDGESGAAQRMASRAAAAASKAASYKRLAMAAVPLIKSLDETQRREALILARAFGFEHLAAAF
jgi:hypothetical protein